MRYIIATNNKNKLIELDRILAPLGITVSAVKELGISLPEVEETGDTFMENARLKASVACNISGLPAIADDSGLEVKALGGAPGIYSARYAGEGASDDEKIDKLLKNMHDVPEGKRDARFVCAICCVYPDGSEICASGESYGKIAYERIGTGGFGYDPVFICENNKSFAELTDEEKDGISHRGRALRELAKKIEMRNRA